MQLALFDLDGTLTPLDTEDEWIRALGAEGLVDVAPHERFHADYLAGCMDERAYLEWYLRVLATLPAEAVARVGDAVVARVLASVGDQQRGWVADERARCDAVLLVSATNAFLVEPIGRALELDGVVASRYALAEGRFTGELDGEYNLGAAKLRGVRSWLARRGTDWEAVERSACYADSINDLPLMEACSEPVAVDPAEPLAARARERGWPIVRTR